MSKWLALFLIIIGAVFIAFPIYSSYKVNTVQANLENQWNNLNTAYASDEPDLLQQQPTVESANDQPNDKPDKTSDKQTESKVSLPRTAIGKITIDKIDLSAYIVKGVEAKDLKYAVGWFPDTSLPDQGSNMALAGHRSYTYGQFFNRLDELKNGDMITIETKKGIYRYKVYKKFVVKPTEVSVLNPSKKSELTLITCTPMYSSKNRLIVKAIKV
ncbi:class D sortase [Falsibacillus pallidus]|uniref:Sortase A n=1 Tax=Falsibacillus pallidus TaxID=493781 RepID=A0A370GR59_9BACI|nr:class D sortase [Falsibacillus pallidus]RDI45810.1 sortase A [Falsibacillus pallidus]